MLRIHLTADDLAHVRLAPRPAPMLELNIALVGLMRPCAGPRQEGRRQRMLRALPAASAALRDVVPGPYAPTFLDVPDDDWQAGRDRIRSTPVSDVSAELARAYAVVPVEPPAWVHDLGRGDRRAWAVFDQGQRAAFDTLLAPVWDVLRDRHAAEFTRHALVVAAHGIGAGLADLLPGSRFRDGVWELHGSPDRDVHPTGRGLVLQPSFHHTGGPLVMDLPGHEVVVTYAAGPPLSSGEAATTSPDALTRVLGPTRAALLRLLTDRRSTGTLARDLGVSAPTVSEHTAALRDAGLITSTRTGRAVLHTRTALGTLLLGPRA